MTTNATNKTNLSSTKSFAVAAWIVAKGHDLKVEMRPEGTFYLFSPEAADDVLEFYAAKNKVNALMLLAQK